jgi:universal stress protein E
MVESEGTVIAELADSVRDWGVDVECGVRWGHPPEDVILAEIERWGADLLVIGTHQPGARPHTRLAQVDWQLMRGCPCPILVARDPQFRGYASIVAAVDPLHRHAEPERLDRRILEIATTLTASAGARLEVVHVCPSAESFALASSIEVSPGVYYGSENIEQLHRQALQELVAEFGIRRTSTVLLHGDPAEQLADYLREKRADLVVLGALKRGVLEEWVLGSTAERIVAEVGCDVLLVKPDN